MISIWNKLKTWCSEIWEKFTLFFSNSRENIEDKIETFEREEVIEKVESAFDQAVKIINEATEDAQGNIDTFKRTKMINLVDRFKEEPEQIARVMIREFGEFELKGGE